MQLFIQTIFYLTTIFIPLTFTTFTSELFEFPKFLILIAATITIIIAVLIDLLILHRPLNTVRHPYKLLDYTLLAFLLSQIISTLSSINPYTSFWGYYSRFHQGLLSTVCYTILYFAARYYLDKKSTQKIIKLSIYTSIVISLYAIFQRFGIDQKLWIQDVVNRPFSTLGQPNWLAAYLLPNLFLTLYFTQAQSQKNNRLLPTLFFALILTAILLTKSRSGFLALSISYPTYFLLLVRQFDFKKISTHFYRSFLTLVLAICLVGTPFTPKLNLLNLLTHPNTITKTPTSSSPGTQLENGGTESGDIRKIVWQGAFELFRRHPFLGTGPETFAYTYYWTRPLAHNYTSEWDYLYNKAHNEYLNMAATSGILGLLTYLGFHFALFLQSIRTTPHTKKTNQTDDDLIRSYSPVLGATILAFTITNLFGFSVIPVYFLVILLAAISLTLVTTTDSHAPTHTPLYFIPLLSLFYPYLLLRADMLYTQARAYLDAQKPAAALPLLLTATTLRQSEPLYRSTLSEAYATLGKTDEAISEAKITKNLNPYHLNYYKSRAKTYLTLATLDPKYYSDVIDELKQSRALAPTDPKLAYNLGLVYTRQGNNAEAIAQLRDAIRLKSDYESPYYALTLLYEQTNQKNLIPELLNSARTNLATYSSALNEKINTYK